MFDSGSVFRPMAASRSAWMPWLVCLSAGFFFLYEFFQLNVFDVINQPLRDAFQMNPTQLSWMSSAYVWANVLWLLPAGFLLDRFATRRVILVAMALCVLGTLGFALARTAALAVFFHALTGVGNAFCFVSCVVLISRWFAPRRQALAIGCVVTMAFIGGMMAHTPFSYLSHAYGWRTAMLIDAALGALMWLWIFWIVVDSPQQRLQAVAEDHASRRVYFSGFASVLANPKNALAGLYTACLNLPIMVLCALWGASYLKTVHQLTDLAASSVVSLLFMGSIVGCPLVGWWSDRIGRRKPLMIAGAVATCVATLPLLTGYSLSFLSLSVLFFLLGFLTSTQVIAYPLIAESNPIERTGLATGIASVIIMGGGGLGQVLFGLLMRGHSNDTLHSYRPADFDVAMWMFPIAALVALVAIALVQETHCGGKRRIETSCKS